MGAYTRHLTDSKVTLRLTEDEPPKPKYPEPVLCDVCGKRVRQNKLYCRDCQALVTIAYWSSSAMLMLGVLYDRRGLTELDSEKVEL